MSLDDFELILVKPCLGRNPILLMKESASEFVPACFKNCTKQSTLRIEKAAAALSAWTSRTEMDRDFSELSRLSDSTFLSENCLNVTLKSRVENFMKNQEVRYVSNLLKISLTGQTSLK